MNRFTFAAILVVLITSGIESRAQMDESQDTSASRSATIPDLQQGKLAFKDMIWLREFTIPGGKESGYFSDKKLQFDEEASVFSFGSQRSRIKHSGDALRLVDPVTVTLAADDPLKYAKSIGVPPSSTIVWIEPSKDGTKLILTTDSKRISSGALRVFGIERSQLPTFKLEFHIESDNVIFLLGDGTEYWGATDGPVKLGGKTLSKLKAVRIVKGKPTAAADSGVADRQVLATVQVFVSGVGSEAANSEDRAAVTRDSVQPLILAGKWEEVSKMEPSDAVSEFLLSIAYGVLEQWDEMHEHRSRMEKQQGSGTQVLGFATGFAEKHQGNSNAQFVLGHALLANGDADGAIRAYKQVVILAPASSDGYIQLAQVYGKSKNDWQTALRYATGAVKANPHSATACLSLGDCNEKLGRYDDAIAAYSDGLAILKEKSIAKGYLLGKILRGMGWIYVHRPTPDNDRAITILMQAIKADPKGSQSHEAYNDLGVVYKRKGMFDKAIECYRNGIRLNPNADDAASCLYFNLGVAYYRNGMTAEARQAFEEAVKREPGGRNAERARQWLSQM